MRTTEAPPTSALTGDLKVDVCVVGAGIAGLTTAYMLMLEGKSVMILDDGVTDGGDTDRITAHLTNALEHRYCELERLYGEQGSRLVAQNHTAALRWIETIITNEKIDCDFKRVDGYLFTPPEESPDILQRELAAAHRAGLTEVQGLSRVPVDSFDTGPCLRFPQQAQFDPLKYLRGLSRVIQRNGGRIFLGTQIERIDGGSLAWVETKAGPLVMADAVVVATNTPVNDDAAIRTKLVPSHTYVIGTKVPPGSVPRALYWDTASPCHSVRVDSIPVGRWSEEARELLIVCGENHKVGQAEDPEAHWARLEQWARQRFPMISGIDYRWTGQVREPSNSLAFIGRNPMVKPNVYVATADSGPGMTHGTIASLLLKDLISGRKNEWAGVYDPSRITPRAAKDFSQENLSTAAQYGG